MHVSWFDEVYLLLKWKSKTHIPIYINTFYYFLIYLRFKLIHIHNMSSITFTLHDLKLDDFLLFKRNFVVIRIVLLEIYKVKL